MMIPAINQCDRHESGTVKPFRCREFGKSATHNCDASFPAHVFDSVLFVIAVF